MPNVLRGRESLPSPLRPRIMEICAAGKTALPDACLWFSAFFSRVYRPLPPYFSPTPLGYLYVVLQFNNYLPTNLSHRFVFYLQSQFVLSYLLSIPPFLLSRVLLNHRNSTLTRPRCDGGSSSFRLWMLACAEKKVRSKVRALSSLSGNKIKSIFTFDFGYDDFNQVYNLDAEW